MAPRSGHLQTEIVETTLVVSRFNDNKQVSFRVVSGLNDLKQVFDIKVFFLSNRVP